MMFRIILLLFCMFFCSTSLVQNDININVLSNNNEAKKNQHPYQVAIIPSDGKNEYICSGSLVSETMVLTAASCVKDMKSANLYFGYHELMSNTSNDQQIFGAKSFYYHLKYDNSTFQNDIAIIELNGQVKLNSIVQTIQLDESTDDHTGEMSVVAGWGSATSNVAYISTLQSIERPIMSNEDCQHYNKKFEAVVQPTHICLPTFGIRGVCGGDAGSPLVVNGVQVGIASFQSEQCNDIPSGFTRVNKFQSWIKTACSNCRFGKISKNNADNDNKISWLFIMIILTTRSIV